MNDEKLSLLRNLVIVMVGLVLVVGGIVISQTQDIRSDLKNLHEEAVRALKSSELDKRMKTMEDSMGALDGKLQQAEQRMSDRLDAESQALDGKIKNAEDHMMNRAERELPAIMDREVEKQKRKIIQEAQQGNLPH